MNSVTVEGVARVVEALAALNETHATRLAHAEEALNEVAWAFWGPVLDATGDTFHDSDELSDRIRGIAAKAAAEIEAVLAKAEAS